MDNKELINLSILRSRLEYAKGVCDPIEFQKRQQAFLYQICDHLLIPLNEHEESIKEGK